MNKIFLLLIFSSLYVPMHAMHVTRQLEKSHPMIALAAKDLMKKLEALDHTIPEGREAVEGTVRTDGIKLYVNDDYVDDVTNYGEGFNILNLSGIPYFNNKRVTKKKALLPSVQQTEQKQEKKLNDTQSGCEKNGCFPSCSCP